MLSIIAAVMVYRKFGYLAESKGLKKAKWGWIGVAWFVGVSLTSPFIIDGLLIASNPSYEPTMLMNFVGLFIGAGAAALSYQKLKNKPSDLPNIKSFMEDHRGPGAVPPDLSGGKKKDQDDIV